MFLGKTRKSPNISIDKIDVKFIENTIVIIKKTRFLSINGCIINTKWQMFIFCLYFSIQINNIANLTNFFFCLVFSHLL
jgi:hypothetical protein